MFQTTTAPFGAFTEHRLFNADTQDSFSLIPERSAVLLDLQLQGRSILEGFSGPNEMDINPWSKNRLLYPFPNRLAGGSYQWEGKTYQFPLNDDNRDNALHGFSMDRNFNVVSTEEDVKQGCLICEYTYHGEETYYPFPFILRVKYQLKEHAFEMEMSMRNTGASTLPSGLGWHPYFSWTEDVKDLVLQIPSVEMIGVNAQMIPTGKQYEYGLFQSARPIRLEILDNCFLLKDTSTRAEVSLSDGEKRLIYWQDCGPKQYNYIQVFTPPHRQSLAIEPMSCNIDAFNNGDGLIALAPGEEVEMRCGLFLDKLGIAVISDQ